jgi:HAD superfamily hydrolase (TIGR01509 family)
LSARAVLFDVGGPLDTEVHAEAAIDAAIKAHLREHGIPVSDDDYGAANRWAIESFAPDTYAAILWRLCDGDPELAERVGRPNFGPREFQLRDGVAQLLAELHGRGLLLGLAANQPARTLEVLDGLGIGRYFAHREVSGHHGLHKPDVRLFLRACEGLGVAPEETVMVGDRIDNDIAPARRLGMYTILFRTGRHIEQQPRSAEDLPHAEVTTVEGLGAALDGALS